MNNDRATLETDETEKQRPIPMDRTASRKRGVRMAMQIAAITGGVAAGLAAFGASDASAEQSRRTAAGDEVGPVDALRVQGLAGFSCMSRGPAAPPEQRADDFALLLAEVPS